jgi:hypothetical protein
VDHYLGYLDYVIFAAMIVVVGWFIFRKLRQRRAAHVA